MKPYEQTIFNVLQEVASQRNPELPPLRKSQTLTYDLGLRSLDLAQLVATLELELRADPFAQLVAITSVRTVGDVCDAYQLYFDMRESGGAAPFGIEGSARAAARQHAAESSRTEASELARSQKSA